MDHPTLLTARLVLRPPQPTDAPAIFANYAQDPEVVRYLTWLPHQSIAETETILARIIASNDPASQLSWSIVRASDQAMIGMIALRIDRFKAEVGYSLSRATWGQGLMTEALQAIIEYAWSRPEIYRVAALCDVQNPASARVMEKAGMTYEGTLRRYSLHPNASTEPSDCMCYAIVR